MTKWFHVFNYSMNSLNEDCPGAPVQASMSVMVEFAAQREITVYRLYAILQMLWIGFGAMIHWQSVGFSTGQLQVSTEIEFVAWAWNTR